MIIKIQEPLFWEKDFDPLGYFMIFIQKIIISQHYFLVNQDLFNVHIKKLHKQN